MSARASVPVCVGITHEAAKAIRCCIDIPPPFEVRPKHCAAEPFNDIGCERLRIDFLFSAYLQRTNVCILLYLCQPARRLEKSRARTYCTESCFGVRWRSGWALTHPELSPCS